MILVVNKTDRPDARIAEVVEESHDLLLDLASDLDDEAPKAAELALGLPRSTPRAARARPAPPSRKTAKPRRGEPGRAVRGAARVHPRPRATSTPRCRRTSPTSTPRRSSAAWPWSASTTAAAQGSARGLDAQGGRPSVINNAKITELLLTVGVERTPAEEAVAGDIVAVAGIPDIMIGDTLADSGKPGRAAAHHRRRARHLGDHRHQHLADGRQGAGHKLTARMVKSRLDSELVGNVSIKVVDIDRPDAWEVQGRGELALAVLVEQMRREGFELTVGKPQVVTQIIDGKLHEPFEAMTIDCPEEFVGAITQLMAARKGRMEEMANHAAVGGADGLHRAEPRPDRFPYRLLQTLNSRHRDRQCRVRRLPAVGRRDQGAAHRVAGVRPHRVDHPVRHDPAVRPRPVFVQPGEDTYEGQVVGINPRAEDLDVNVTREKKLTNMRSSTADVMETLARPLELGLEQAMEFCAEDECVEVTPEVVRVRKVELVATLRARAEGAGQGPRLAAGCAWPKQRAPIPCWACRNEPAGSARTACVLVSSPAFAGCTVSPPPVPHRTETKRSTIPPPQRKTQIIMGIDSIGAGFNPHLLSDLSAVNAAISALVLPSAFRPVPDPATPTGSRWEMDPTLLVSAEVTGENPFTVTYKIRPEGAMDRQRPDCRRRLLVPVATDGRPTWCGRPGRL